MTGCNTPPWQDGKITPVSGHRVQFHIQVFSHQRQLLANKFITSLSTISISPNCSTAAAVSRRVDFRFVVPAVSGEEADAPADAQAQPSLPVAGTWQVLANVAVLPASSWTLGLSQGETPRSQLHGIRKPYVHSWN